MSVLQPQSSGIPLPHPTPLSQPFWDGCAASELRYQRCESCDSPMFIPAMVCRSCGGRSLRWERSEGRGTVYSWSMVWRPQSPSFTSPYAAAIIDLDEGYQMLSNVIGCSPDDVRSGMRGGVEFHDVGGIQLPYFRPGEG